jgi:hypothetical protein
MSHVFLQYESNQPVLLRIENNPSPLVGDLVVAAATEPTRQLLGLPQEHGPLKLYSDVDGEARRPQTLLSSLLADNANMTLIIKRITQGIL